MTIVALIPARAGSRRIPRKNTKLLNGVPLIAYTIAAAQQSGIFDTIVVCTDDTACISIAQQHGVALAWRMTPVPDDQPDILWVREALRDRRQDAFAILRPTSPFRTPATIQSAWATFQAAQPVDSVRAVRPVREHPGKMWWSPRGRLFPVVSGMNEYPATYPDTPGDLVPWHSSPTQSLPPAYMQTASLEIAWVKTVTEQGTISGDVIAPFFIEGHEGFDLNTPEDWARAEQLIAEGVPLPKVTA